MASRSSGGISKFFEASPPPTRHHDSWNESRIVLHVGAHRTGTTLFQEYLRQRSEAAQHLGIFFRGIKVTREELLRDVIYRDYPKPSPSTSDTTAALREHLSCKNRRVLVSDENIIGTMENNFLKGALYPNPVEHISRISTLLPSFDTLYISVRTYSDWWMSAFAHLVENDHIVFHRGTFDEVFENKRGWFEVVQEIGEAYPMAKIIVREFGYQTDNPKRQLREVTGWRDLSEKPNVRKRANPSLEAPDLERRLRERGLLLLADSFRSGQGLGPFSLNKREQFHLRYLEDLKKIHVFLRGRGRMLVDPETRRIIGAGM